jgi:hypothetical protein
MYEHVLRIQVWVVESGVMYRRENLAESAREKTPTRRVLPGQERTQVNEALILTDK